MRPRSDHALCIQDLRNVQVCIRVGNTNAGKIRFDRMCQLRCQVRDRCHLLTFGKSREILFSSDSNSNQIRTKFELVRTHSSPRTLPIQLDKKENPKTQKMVCCSLNNTHSQGGTKNTRMTSLLNYRLKVSLLDNRSLVGQLLAFDKHMNLVLGDTQEFRKLKNAGKSAPSGAPEREEKRALGLIVLRGETIVSLSIEAPPPAADKRVPASFIPGPGMGRPAGRGLPMAPPGGAPMMGGPVLGLGGPAPGSMQPHATGAPVQYQRPPMMPPMGGPPPGFRPGMPMPPPGFRPGMPMPPPGFRPVCFLFLIF